MIHAGTATAVHDVSDGGLLIALAEMAMASDIGAQLLAAPGSTVPHAFWFGEDQARYIVTVPAADAGLVLAKMKGAGVPCARIGTTGGDAIAVAGETAVSINTLKSAFERWLPDYMGGKTKCFRRFRSPVMSAATCGTTRALAPACRCAHDGLQDHSTLFAPGICRSARVNAQLNATVSTKPIATLMIAGQS
jgi:hypothetical protein